MRRRSNARNSLGNAYQDAGRTDDAIVILEPLVDDLERILGGDHPSTLGARNNLANGYLDAGRADEAIAILEPLVDDLERVLGAEHPDAIGSHGNLANAYEAAGRDQPTPRCCGVRRTTRRPTRAGSDSPANSGWDDGPIARR